MRQLIFLFLLCTSSISFSQEYGDKAYYIIDSLNLSSLNALDSDSIRRRLDTYHNAHGKVERLVALCKVSEDLENIEAQLAYASYGLSRIRAFIRRNEEKLTNEERYALREAESSILANLGMAHNHLGDHNRSLSYLFEAKKISEEIGSKKQLTSNLINIGSVFYDQDNLTESISYHEKAAELNLEIGDTSNALYMLNNMGAIYNNRKEYDKAKVVLDSCINLSTQVGDKLILGMALNNLGGVYCKSKETIDTGLVLLEQALTIFEELQSDQWLAFTYSKLGSIYLKIKAYEKAHQHGLKAEEYAEKLGFKELIRRSSMVLKETYWIRKDYKSAYHYSEKHAKIDQELRGEENRMQALRLENQFKLEKQKEIDDKELALANASKETQEIVNNALIAGAIALFIFTLFVIYRLRLSNRRKRKIEQQNNERRLLLMEIHHRVKNNFQIISSLLRLQAAEEKSEHIENVFDDAVSRIQSMASVHELIYKQEMFAELSTKEYLEKLINTIRSYSVHSKVKISAATEVDRLNIKTLIPIGITINELVTNSLKYAFEVSSVEPQIEVSLLKQSENEFTLIYKDNGTGFEHSESESSFGMELIDTVISQIDGVLLRKGDSSWKNKVEIKFKEVV